VIRRAIESELKADLFKGKAIVLLGPRQVGKTTLVKELLSKRLDDAIFINGDDPNAAKLFVGAGIEQLRAIIGNKTILFIDEAQRIANIGLIAKMIVDQFAQVQLILSGSSAFDINQETQEPLTGRKWTHYLWPIAWEEYEKHEGFLKAERSLESRLVFGLYPDVINRPEKQEKTLLEIADSYLYKDVLIYGNIKKPTLLQKLLQALAHQVGHEVSYAEVAQLIGSDPKTVTAYIDLLEKAFVLFRLPAFSRNLRDEIKTNRKIFFYDNGIRNAVIGQLQPLSARMDVGALWENFLVSERLKQIHYRGLNSKGYFWRSKQQQEIDYVEEWNGKISGFQFKWNEKRNINFSKTFTDAYQAANKGVTRANFREFVVIKNGTTTLL
jgi:uncharacterized protein